jgi:hypothetical protein
VLVPMNQPETGMSQLNENLATSSAKHAICTEPMDV